MDKDNFILCCFVIFYLIIRGYYIISLITLFLLLKYNIQNVDNTYRAPAYGSSSCFY